MAPFTCRTMLERIVTSCTTRPGRGVVLVSRREHERIAGWLACQLFSMMLPSIRTRWAFFNSIVFFTFHNVPLVRGVPDVSPDPV